MFILLTDESDDDEDRGPSRKRRMAERAAEGVAADEDDEVRNDFLSVGFFV